MKDQEKGDRACAAKCFVCEEQEMNWCVGSGWWVCVGRWMCGWVWAVGPLSLILKSLIISLMQKSDIGAYIRLCIVNAAADVLAG